MTPAEAQAQLVALVADAVDPLRESAVAYTPEGVGIVAVAAVLAAPELLLAAMGNEWAICGVVSESGANGEPLACGFKKGHKDNHAWATLPTFIRKVEQMVREAKGYAVPRRP